MNVIKMLTLIVSIVMMGFLACGDDTLNPVSSETVTLTIINGLGAVTIYYVYVSPSGSDSWGSDRLGTANILSPGESGTLELSKGVYDIRVVDEDGDEYFRWNLQLNSDYTWTVRLSDLSL